MRFLGIVALKFVTYLEDQVMLHGSEDKGRRGSNIKLAWILKTNKNGTCKLFPRILKS